MRTGQTLRQLRMDQVQRAPALGAQDAVLRPPDDRQVVTGHRGGAIRIWDAATGDLVGQLESQRQ